jgi:hypothetical protein
MIQFPTIQDKLFFEMTPLLPTTEYDDLSTSFHPYALARFSEISGLGVEMEIFSFVTLPEISGSDDFIETDDLIAVSFDFSPLKNRVLTFICNAGERCEMYLNGVSVGTYPCARKTGEDERGVYWYVSLRLTPDTLQEYFGISSATELSSVKGNVFKYKKNAPHRHFGAVAPFVKAYDVFDPENLADYPVIRM